MVAGLMLTVEATYRSRFYHHFSTLFTAGTTARRLVRMHIMMHGDRRTLVAVHAHVIP